MSSSAWREFWRQKDDQDSRARLTNKNIRKENIMTAMPESVVKTIVLVHGGFVDGSGWGDIGPQGLLSIIQLIP
jgi:hypothetical protein